MYGIPDHPDIEAAMRTGYPRSYSYPEDHCDPDFEYESMREEELLDDEIDE